MISYCYATDQRDPMWTACVQRHADVLLVRRALGLSLYRNTKPFAVAEVSPDRVGGSVETLRNEGGSEEGATARDQHLHKLPQHPKASRPRKATNPVP